AYKVKTGYLVKALLNVPLKATGEVIGVLAVNNKTSFRAFEERHLNLLMALADYASISIQNAQLYTQLTSDVNRAESSNRTLKRTVEVTTAELQEANAHLVKSEKLMALGHLATGVAEKMDTPINNILDNLHQLSNRLEPEIDAQKFLQGLKREAMDCQKTVQSLLDFAGQKPQSTQDASLNDLIEAAWAKYNNEADINSDVQFVRGFDPMLPFVSVDQNQMEQALYYLVGNAYRAMPSQGTLRITTRAVGSDIQVIISDTGPGISPEDMRHIFDPFYEINGQTPGLNLSIAYSVIERHQGTVEVESAAGQGTTFNIRLPRSV
ncbi:MAG: ATP-binding protein, partial [Chloroflexota bacterium]